MQFNLDLSGLGGSISETLGSMNPIFFIVAGLVIASQVLSWGIDMLRSWRENREADEEDAAWHAQAEANGWLDENGVVNDKYVVDTYGKRHYDDPD